MRLKLFLTLLLISSGLSLFLIVQANSANCGDTWYTNGSDTFAFNCSEGQLTKTSHWKVYWLDGYNRTVDVKDTGVCESSNCYPQFNAPYFEETSGIAVWHQFTGPADSNAISHECRVLGAYNDHIAGHRCLYADEGGCAWCESYQTCRAHGCTSPVVIDVLGNGFNLTDAANGVDFDLSNRGTPYRLSWTAANSDDA
jgi:hypothetical protein